MPALNRFENRRLLDESLRAFVRAIHTDRMVAVTGAMSTERLGYPTWRQFAIAYALIADQLASEIIAARESPTSEAVISSSALLRDIGKRAIGLIQDLQHRNDPQRITADQRVSMWTLHELFRSVDREMRQNRAGLVINNRYQGLAVQEFERRVGAIFLSRLRPAETERMLAAIRPLIRSLGVKRFATLNYDLELERSLMLRRDEQLLIKLAELDNKKSLETGTAAKEFRKEILDILKEIGDSARIQLFATRHRSLTLPSVWPASENSAGSLESLNAFVGPAGSGKPIIRGERGKLSRTMGDGVHVESDVADRERPDHLFEFAIGSTEISRHIFHLHGRADDPATMVANIRQYDRLYRLDDLYRDPFDHGLRMLIGGNPILFVGIGMSEPEINDYLQYFVSNTPIRRPAPIFVLWNRGPNEKDWEQFKIVRRLDFRVRLGAHLIFDDDFDTSPKEAGSLLAVRSKALREPDPLEELPTLIANLPALVDRIDRRMDRRPDRWRSIDAKLSRNAAEKKPSRMWGSTSLINHAADAKFVLPRTDDDPGKKPKLIFAYSKNGFGRGALSENILQREHLHFTIGNSVIAHSEPVDRLLINAGFSYDSDSMLSGIARFLAPLARRPPDDFRLRRERYFADGRLLKLSRQALIIVNGADRFFGSDGAPLSAEFDHFLRCVDIHAKRLQVLLLCTSRMRRYSQMLGYPLESLSKIRRQSENHSQKDDRGKRADLDSSYLESIRRKFDAKRNEILRKKHADALVTDRDAAELQVSVAAEAMLRRANKIDRDAQKRTFFEAHLSPPLLRALGLNCPATFEVLRTLSFIGAPVEGAVLLYAPKVRAMLAERSENISNDRDWPLGSRTDAHNEDVIRAALSDLLIKLLDLGLLISISLHDGEAPREGHDEKAPEAVLASRYGMHRSLASYIRDRHGAPVNDAKLATQFNMSIFMSEPSDSITPEPTFHDELGDLVDTFAGAWHDVEQFRGESIAKFMERIFPGRSTDDKEPGEWILTQLASRHVDGQSKLGIEDLYIASADRERAIANLPWYVHRDSAACLRAALAVVRGYYSTGALLRFDRNERIAATDRDGALTEHAQRLDRLISVFGDIATARSIARRAVARQLNKTTEKDDQGRDGRDEFEAAIGPEPCYADDLVWLLNERATVALAKGHLFHARDALSVASQINSDHVEHGHHGHNWRRIAISQVSIKIERGSLTPAERLLDEIDVAVNAAPWAAKRERRKTNAVSRVSRIRRMVEDDDLSSLVGDREFTREEIFVVAMTTGYRGLIAHLRGRYHEADEFYATAVRMLRRMGEQRAYAHFQRHRATLEGFFGDKSKALNEIEHAIAAAQAARQMDILHRSRVVRADLIRDTSQDQAKRRHALSEIKEALRYSALADCYRVRIEASASMARHMRIDGDYDTALRYGVDAMTIAARYGHSLQKTSLRIELGRILEARGDPVSGRALLEMAVSIGTSKGYFHALERVRRILKPSSPAVNWAHFKTSG